MKIAAPVLLLSLVACSRHGGGDPIGNDADRYVIDGSATLSPGVKPVRVGEGGPAFRACSITGRVVKLSPAGEAYLPLRAAPFAEAAEVARLADGARLYICTSSLDQRWQGVVVPPAGSPAADCGVAGALATPRAYAGPCRSGWVLSAFVAPVAD